MPASKGNKNAVGNRGGERKSAYQEGDNADKLFKAFFEPVDQEEIEARIRSGMFSIWDRVVLSAMEGDNRIMAEMMKKVFPEKHEHQLPPGTVVFTRPPDAPGSTRKGNPAQAPSG